MTKVAVIGANGQLGSDIVKVFRAKKWRVTPLLHHQIEIKDWRRVHTALGRVRPTIVINTAAFHDTVACERQPQKALTVNGLGVKNLADWCRDNQALLVHFSTDYVFGGEVQRRRPYRETDAVAPQSVYAISKITGELFIQARLQKYFLIRTCGLYGVAGSRVKGKNFVDKRIDQAKKGETIYMVDDQVLSPTYTVTLAENVALLLKTRSFGLYHMSSMGACSWYEFTKEILRLVGLRTEVVRVKTDDMKAGVIRPRYSVLSKSKLTSLNLNQMRHWRENLKVYLREKGYLI